jgi:SRSO17 transposase
VPDEIHFATKTQIALAQLRTLLADGAPHHCVLADAGYGVDTGFRQALSDMGLIYAVGVTSAVSVWPPGVEPLPPKLYSGMGRPPVMPRRTAGRQPMSVKALALSLPAQAFHSISWREGTNEPLSGRFAALRVRHAGGNAGKARLRPLQWLLVEWPADQAEPTKYVLSTLPEDTPLNELVSAAHQRWRIERDYQDLKQDFGLGHYEGRGWRGFHHHASLSIAAYGFLMTERLIADKPVGSKKNFIERQVPALPKDYIPRGSPARPAARGPFDHDATPSPELRTDRAPRAVPLLRQGGRKASLVTQ